MSGFDALRQKLDELGPAAAELERRLDRGAFLPCSWECGSCGENGSARPWRRPGETPTAAAARFAGETRSRCVDGCTFTAAAAGDQDAG